MQSDVTVTDESNKQQGERVIRCGGRVLGLMALDGWVSACGRTISEC
jgi:hypothetical protein